LKLSEKEVHHGNLSGTVSTLTEGLAIEKAQYACPLLFEENITLIYSQNHSTTSRIITGQKLLNSSENRSS
jgi:hypothetical protein